MRYVLFLLSLMAILFSGCNADPANQGTPTGTPHESAKITAYYDFDTTDWVVQDKAEVASTFSLLANAGNVMKAEDIVAVYGRTDTVLQHPFFLIFHMEMGETPTMSQLEEALGAAPMNADRVKSQIDESLHESLTNLEINKPVVDRKRKMFVVRGSNLAPEGLVQTISTNFVVSGGMVNITGAYIEGNEQGMVQAYSDVVDSFSARRK